MDITTWKKLYYMQQKISKGSRLGRISLGIAFYILTAYLISSAAMPWWPWITSFLPSFGLQENRADLLHAHIRSQPPEAFHNNPWALVAAIEDFTATKHMMTFKEPKRKIAQTALESMPVKPKVIVEFGTYVGVSALAWGAVLQGLHGPDKDCKVYTFELDPKMVQVSRDMVHLAGLDDLVHVVEGPATESLKRLYIEGKITAGGVDMVFFDHWEKHYVPDLQLCEQLGIFREGALAIADNTDMPGAPDYLKYVRAGGTGNVKYESKGYESETPTRGPRIVEISTIVKT